MEKLRKSCDLDEKCSKRCYVLTRISTFVSNQNLIIKLKSLGYLNFSTAAPISAKQASFCSKNEFFTRRDKL